TDQEKIRAFIDAQLCGMEYTLTLDQSAYPFVTDASTPIVRTLRESIVEVCGITPKNSTAWGTSDARFVARYGIDVIEFGVINDTIHAPNERTSIAEVEKLYSVFTKLIHNFR
ncbi:MAG: M20/M25/M40 family metallo-hydrolase, partial [Campylobacterales bacterium]|nr:M20/M25/M40 family metallo-hydrolase [Campylobacterales bacterium]